MGATPGPRRRSPQRHARRRRLNVHLLLRWLGQCDLLVIKPISHKRPSTNAGMDVTRQSLWFALVELGKSHGFRRHTGGSGISSRSPCAARRWRCTRKNGGNAGAIRSACASWRAGVRPHLPAARSPGANNPGASAAGWRPGSSSRSGSLSRSAGTGHARCDRGTSRRNPCAVLSPKGFSARAGRPGAGRFFQRIARGDQ
jgi:hypothetical protein